MQTTLYPLKNRREMFLDEMLTGSVVGDITLRQHFPQPQAPEASLPDGYYQTSIQEPDGLIRRYYRGIKEDYDGDLYDGNPGEYVGYVESRDGIHWEYPELNLFPDVPANTIWAGTMETHNFVPFRDDNPACPAAERYKAVAGIRACGGLSRFYSADGIHWQRYAGGPFLAASRDDYVWLDSQNICFWSESERCYVLYYRVYIVPDGLTLPPDHVWDDKYRRAVARVTSADFQHWSEPVVLDMNRPEEHLYVSLFAPYFRAPHFYLATPTRFFVNRGAATDITFCHTRNGVDVMRPFPGAWITPGLDPARWGNRSNYLSWQMVQTGADELSLYHCKSRVRYTIRLDGFASLHAGVAGGCWESVPMAFAPGRLECNVATSAGGGFRVGVLDGDGRPLPGFGVEDCEVFYGDSTAMNPRWQGGACPPLQEGEPFRLQFQMTECDIFSFCFAPEMA